MNMILRMAYVLLLSLFRERLTVGNATSKLTLRVLPNDIDINFHMNNERYMTICDLNREDLFACSGLLKAMFKRNWIPVIAEHTMSYKKPLGMFHRFEVRLDMTRWDEKYFYMTHTFKHVGRLAAVGTSKACVFARGREVVSPQEVIAAVNEDSAK